VTSDGITFEQLKAGSQIAWSHYKPTNFSLRKGKEGKEREGAGWEGEGKGRKGKGKEREREREGKWKEKEREGKGKERKGKYVKNVSDLRDVVISSA
jgi:hypothetical protein